MSFCRAGCDLQSPNEAPVCFSMAVCTQPSLLSFIFQFVTMNREVIFFPVHPNPLHVYSSLFLWESAFFSVDLWELYEYNGYQDFVFTLLTVPIYLSNGAIFFHIEVFLIKPN